QKQLVLVDFYTDGCPHCQKMAPIVAHMYKQYDGVFKVAQVDVMNNPQLAHKYDIGPVPAFLVFTNGKLVEAVAGEVPESELVSLIKPHLGTHSTQISSNQS